MRFIFLALLFILSTSAFGQSKATQKLFKSIQKNDLVLAQNSLIEGADVNGIDDIKKPSTTPLLKAVEHKRHQIVSLLLTNNADVNQRRPSDFYTGLMIASKNNDLRMTKILVGHGADVNLETLKGQTALHLAAIQNSTESVEALLSSREIDVNAGGENCPLVFAAREGHVGMSLLLKKQSGSKAVSPICLEKAAETAEKKQHEMLARVLKRN